MPKFCLLAFALCVLTVAANAQCVECNNPNNPAEDCGQCCVTGKSCQPANGRCPDPTCEWCQKIVRTEFCGIFLLAPSCWCFAAPEATVREENHVQTLLARIRRRNVERTNHG